jgi:RHS repeat-associated protein
MDKEIKGNGNSYTTEFRQYDPRLGRWMSLDPVFQPHQSPYNSMDNNPIKNNDPKGDVAGEPEVQAKASLTLTFGGKGQSSLNFAAGIGISSTKGHSMTSANLSLNLSSGGFGSSQVSTGSSSFNGMMTLGLSYTNGNGQGASTDLNIFTSNTISGITNNFQKSATIGTNLSFNNATGFNRAWGVATKVGGFTATINEDFSILPTGFGILASGYDQDNTGGGFLGYTFNNGTSIFAGTEIFTGAPTSYPKSESNDYPGYVAQTKSQQSYNVGRTFLKVDNAPHLGSFRIDYQGQSQMWSQNIIHDIMGIYRFKSTAPNSLQVTR